MKDGKILIEGKIVGGTKATSEKFPYAVQFFNQASMCGGAILSSWSILTAAHCFDRNTDTGEMEVHIGARYTLDFNADRYEVWYFVRHENYNKSMPFECDIALIFVTRQIKYSTRTSKAILVNTDKWMFATDANFTTTGWGETKVPMKDGKILIEGKIVGGTKATSEKFPYAVQFFNQASMCGGAILSSWSILTAAHCFDRNTDTGEMEVHIGARYTLDFNADRYEVWYFVRHENYNKSMPFECDIALIFVTRQIKYSTRTSKAILVNTDKWMFATDANFTTTGWGETKYRGEVSREGLMMTNLQYVSPARCSMMHKLRLTPDMFCLYGDGVRDSCRGDSGGGVEWKGMIVGVVSHGKGCAVKGSPSVYANVWYLRAWIQDQMDRFFDKYCDDAPTAETYLKKYFKLI